MEFLRSALLTLVVCTCCGTIAFAQTVGLDTTRVYELDSITKTAERGPAVVARTTSATTTIAADAMLRLPSRTLTDWLALTPGMTFVSLDGMGYDAQPIVRGFYGGGEAEYVLLQIDGAPIGNGESGLVNWQMLPLRAIGAIEILRGGSSALFGDAALGAVVNVLTRDSGKGGALAVSTGSRVPIDAEVSYAQSLSGRRLHLFGKYSHIDGYRDHSGRDLGSVGGSLRLVSNGSTHLDAMTLHVLSDSDVPGPVFREVANTRPTESIGFFQYDRRKESTHLIGVSGAHSLREQTSLSFRATGKARVADITETVPLSADFADTQQRDLNDVHLSINAQLTSGVGGLPGRLIAGVDASSGWISSDYATLLAGSLFDYLDALPPTPTPAAGGSGGRRTAAAYVHLALEPAARLRITVGGRFDALRDSFNPDEESATRKTHTALSPKLGVNYRFLSRAGAVGNAYANVSRSFKAPTLDQLYDQRAVPVPFPPFEISLSSAELEPQTGTSMELGVYQQIEPVGSDLAAELSLSMYQIDMKDEIDFDLQQLSYRNIGESRHRGIESRLSLYYDDLFAAHLGYTYQATTLEYGDYAGNYVKAIPRDVLAATISLSPAAFLAAVSIRSSRRIYLDDANTIPLPDYTNASVQVGYDFGRFSLACDVFNIFDSRFSTTGFPDPAGSTQVFLYPFADRQVRLTVNVNLP